MATTPINVTGLNVPALTDNTIWFSNAADWNNYWAEAGFSANIQIADTINYGVVKAAATSVYAASVLNAADFYQMQADINGDGILFAIQFPTYTSYVNLWNSFHALKADYDVLRAALVSAGLVSS